MEDGQPGKIGEFAVKHVVEELSQEDDNATYQDRKTAEKAAPGVQQKTELVTTLNVQLTPHGINGRRGRHAVRLAALDREQEYERALLRVMEEKHVQGVCQKIGKQLCA